MNVWTRPWYTRKQFEQFLGQCEVTSHLTANAKTAAITGAENGAKRALKSCDREQDVKKYGGAGAERERSGERKRSGER